MRATFRRVRWSVALAPDFLAGARVESAVATRRTAALWSCAAVCELASQRRGRAHFSSSAGSGAQHAARHCAGMLAPLVEDVAVDDGVFDSLRGHYESAASARQIVLHPRALGGADRALIEDGDIGGQTDLEPSAILDAEKVRGLRGDALDRLFQRHRLAFAHPGAEQI